MCKRQPGKIYHGHSRVMFPKRSWALKVQKPGMKHKRNYRTERKRAVLLKTK